MSRSMSRFSPREQAILREALNGVEGLWVNGGLPFNVRRAARDLEKRMSDINPDHESTGGLVHTNSAFVRRALSRKLDRVSYLAIARVIVRNSRFDRQGYLISDNSALLQKNLRQLDEAFSVL